MRPAAPNYLSSLSCSSPRIPCFPGVCKVTRLGAERRPIHIPSVNHRNESQSLSLSPPAARDERCAKVTLMPSVLSDPQTTKLRVLNTSHVEELDRTGSAQCNLRPPFPANDNLQPWPTTPFSENDSPAPSELGWRLESYPAEIVKLPPARKDMIFAFALVAALFLIAWFYALSFPPVRK